MSRPADTKRKRAQTARAELLRINCAERGVTDDGKTFFTMFFWQPQEEPPCKQKQR